MVIKLELRGKTCVIEAKYMDDVDLWVYEEDTGKDITEGLTSGEIDRVYGIVGEECWGQAEARYGAMEDR